MPRANFWSAFLSVRRDHAPTRTTEIGQVLDRPVYGGHPSGTMALTLVVLSGSSSEPARLTFDSPRIVVGRSANADLRLPDYSVSSRHASFRQRGSDYLVQDEGSTNGTFVGPVKLAPQAPRVLRSGDRVRFGRIWVEAILEAVPATPNAALAAREVALHLVAEALTAGKQDARPRLRLESGKDNASELILERPDHRYVLGTASNSDLALSEANASRRHVEVFVRSSQVYARDLGSKNGTLLAGLPLTSRAETAWPAKAELRIGDHRILLVDPVGAALLELEQGADEVLAPDEEVPVPGEETPINVRAEAPTTASARSARRGQTTAPSGHGNHGSSTKLEFFVGVLSIIVVGVSLFGLYWLLGGH